MNSTVSVIIPVFNGERYLAETLESILTQTQRPDEIICVDDGSTDSSPDIIQQYPQVTYLVQENAGVAVARNTAIEASQGELIALIDQDDLWTPEKLAIQTAFLEEHPDVDIVSSYMQFFLEEGMERPEWIRPGMLEKTQPGYNLGNCLIRRSVFDLVGLFDAQYIISSDHDWFVRLKELAVSWHTLPDVLLHKRVHDQNESRHPFSDREMLQIYRQSTRRRKQQANKDGQ